jgi:hypothetical protein
MTDSSVLNLFQLANPTIVRATSAKPLRKRNQVAPISAKPTAKATQELVKHECELFLVKGPMGKGLGVQNAGVHVAFAAGTGVLVFLDLITRIILHNTGVRLSEFSDEFKFVFYISHRNLSETMGMDLGLKLMQLN